MRSISCCLLPITLILTLVLSGNGNAANDETNPQSVELLNNHGIQTKVTATSDGVLRLRTRISREAQQVIVEMKKPAVGDWQEWALLSNDECNEIVKSIGQSWLWYEHFGCNKPLNGNSLPAPELEKKSEPFIPGIPPFINYFGKCSEGYYVNFRPAKESRYWWFDAGRSIKSECGKDVKIQLYFDNKGANKGRVWFEGKQLIEAIPGADTFDNEVRNRHRRSKLRKIGTPTSHILVVRRLEKLSGTLWNDVVARCEHGEKDLVFDLDYRLSPTANLRAWDKLVVKSEQSKVESNTTSKSTTIDLGGAVEGSTIIARGGAKEKSAEASVGPELKGILRGAFGMEWKELLETSDGSESGISFSVPDDILTKIDRPNADMYLLAIFKALRVLAMTTAKHTEDVYIDELLAESETTIQFISE